MKLRIWTAVMAAMLLIMSAAGGIEANFAAGRAVKPAQGGEAVRAADTGRLTLDYKPATAEIIVTDTASGAVWTSNPADREADKVAKGAKKMDLAAQLLLDYVDDQNKPFQLNSFTGSVKEKQPGWNKVPNGVEVTYSFPKGGFTVPVRYTLSGDALSATIVTEGIKQQGKYKLVNISLLPFFGAAGSANEGYLFVPDGSGALINFNNSKSSYKSYNERVYGGDQSLDYPSKTDSKEAIRLPVFGMRKDDSAFVAVIHNGAYQAGIAAEVSGKNNTYNNVFSYLNLLEFETNLLLEGTLNEKQVTRSSQSMTGGVNYEVKYYFLNGEDADYAGMAAKYRSYLQTELGVKPIAAQAAAGGKQLPLLVDFIGGVKKKGTFLGIPYNTVEALTSFKDAGHAADRLQKDGIVNLTIRMEGWAAGGTKDEVPVSLAAEGKLGGNKGFKKLAKELDSKGIAFYPVVDPVKLYEGGNGFSKFWDAAKGISRAPVLKYDYRLSDQTKNKNLKHWYLLKPAAVNEALDRFTAAAANGGLKHASLQTVGSMIYSDFRRDSQPKNVTGSTWENGLRKAQSNLDGLLFEQPNAYSFPYAQSLSDVPLFASGFDLEDEEVPFYSIALSGLLPAYSEPINLSSMPRRYLLKLIETGTFPAFKFIANDSARLLGTEYDSLYSVDFNLLYEDMKGQYEQLNEALGELAGQAITNHEKLQDGVFRTTFASGKTAVVNYNNEKAAVGADMIPALSYLIR
ncbi:DUF5696 domain-containing protein [Bacillus sp. FJAT-26390]|uniref:DUF5696 domain-containing protein n=1 Tax=Bacillus sp. FJAT-26390 TaxID=1743142 RepID=UPI000807EB62|nr:DUF5696 domain-containing protein [Bacillus sp. FJAT-26390]OBZ12529.1 hypothetical protein A7975_16060 [Bacillus sp. FJAT-26390]